MTKSVGAIFTQIQQFGTSDYMTTHKYYPHIYFITKMKWTECSTSLLCQNPWSQWGKLFLPRQPIRAHHCFPMVVGKILPANRWKETIFEEVFASQSERCCHIDVCSLPTNQKGAVTSTYVLSQPIRMLTNRRISLPANQKKTVTSTHGLSRPIRKSQTYPRGVFISQSDGWLRANPSVNASPWPVAADAISCEITQLFENEKKSHA